MSSSSAFKFMKIHRKTLTFPRFPTIPIHDLTKTHRLMNILVTALTICICICDNHFDDNIEFSRVWWYGIVPQIYLRVELCERKYLEILKLEAVIFQRRITYLKKYEFSNIDMTRKKSEMS